MQLVKESPSQSTAAKGTDKYNGKFACIMFTDIVGYTKLVEKDMESAMATVALNQELHKMKIEQHGGRLIKEMGDGTLASFDSARAAVTCAEDIQSGVEDINGLNLRIGIHMGEVIFSENDVFGIVVNIASRIQDLAHQGQILVSDSVANRLKIKSEIKTRCIGLKKLKNVSNRVRTYAIEGTNAEIGRYQGWTLNLYSSALKVLGFAFPLLKELV